MKDENGKLKLENIAKICIAAFRFSFRFQFSAFSFVDAMGLYGRPAGS
jgi:hypothetical protein